MSPPLAEITSLRMGPFCRRQFCVPSFLLMSTNRSVGSQPEVKSRRIFYSSAPHILAKGSAGKKCSISKYHEIKNVKRKMENLLTGSGS